MPPTPTKGVNLSDVAYIGRQGVKFGIFLIIFLIVGRVVLNATVALYKILNPPKPPGPTYGFGALPPLNFPANATTISTYTLETKDGSLPKLPNLLPVFFMPTQNVSLLSLDKAKQLAAAFGFAFAPEQTAPTTYRWKRTSPLSSTMDIDIVTQQFTMKTDWSSDPSFLSRKGLLNQVSVVQNTRATLQEAELFYPDIATSEAKVSFLKGVGTGYSPAVSLSEADFLQVDIFRLPILFKYGVYRPDPSMGNARFIFSGKETREENMVEASFTYYPIEYERFETYSLIPVQEAWQQLQAGQGFVASMDTGFDKAVVRNVTLGYYDADLPQNYLQPIYIFTGDHNFYGYVPAVAPLGTTTQSSKR